MVTRARIQAQDPAGPVPAPTLPPDLALSASVAAATDEGGGSVAYAVECVVEQALGEKDAAAAKALATTFAQTSRLYRLSDRLPRSRTGLGQRLNASLEEGRQILRGYGYYAGTVSGSIEERSYRPDRKSEKVLVRITIYPGPLYRMGRSEVFAPLPAPLPEDAPPLPRSLADVGLQEGAPAVASVVLAAVDRVKEAFQDNGYPFATVHATRYIVDHQARTLEAEIHMRSGSFVRMGGLEGHGAFAVHPEYMEAMRTWKKGQPWNRSRVEAFRASLRESGLFANLELTPAQQTDRDGNTPLVLVLTPAPERTVGGALEYHSDFGAGVQAFYEHRNLTGQGDHLYFSLPVWEDMQELTASYRLPFFLRNDQSFIANAGLLNQNTDAHSLVSAAASAGLERRFSPQWSGTLQASVEGGSLKDPEKNRHEYLLYGIPVSVTHDSTDSLLNATRGIRVTTSVAPYTGEFNGNFSVLRMRVDSSVYVPLTGEDKLVLALRSALGTIAGASARQVPSSVRFYSGGGGSVRGYEYQSLGPRTGKHKPQGGNSLLEVSAEACWKITPEWGITAFLDGGTAFDDPGGEHGLETGRALRWGTGLGVRYYTVIGPVRFEVATPLNPRQGDDSLQFYISIGQSF